MVWKFFGPSPHLSPLHYQCYQIWGTDRWASETSRSSAPRALLHTYWNRIFGSRIPRAFWWTRRFGKPPLFHRGMSYYRPLLQAMVLPPLSPLRFPHWLVTVRDLCPGLDCKSSKVKDQICCFFCISLISELNHRLTGRYPIGRKPIADLVQLSTWSVNNP